MRKVDAKLLARQIDTFCMANRIAKSDFFSHTGISSATLSQWRNGLYEPSEKSIQAIEEFVGFPIEDLLYGHPATHTPFDPNPLDDFTMAAHGYSGRLSDKDKEIILRLMETLAHDVKESESNGDIK